ncbi:SOS response-associated peptidase [Raineyella sp. W15-4]|uniref:SOS response-associated peptidase n=1 Tax=Raineyella sp. W15-4 TaxID=3081651 RepID=UPI0029548185|nr:SOS response-associated peptidase [Raineyella sp. W15-4]WOQ15537.1 SOS response-associated peptidase [Raineyella sp. W15-4]
MCGRYASSARVDDLVDEFEITEVVAGVPGPSWNVAPTDVVRAVVERRGVRSLVPMRWGLVPSWAKDPAGAARLINARAETAGAKPAFRSAYLRRRCLLPADGYYEWEKAGSQRRPWFIHRADGRPLAMAGLWEVWFDDRLAKDDPGRMLISCAVLTTAATDDLGRIHERMPVPVRPEVRDAWLDRDLQDREQIAGLLAGDPGAGITGHPVSPAVGKVANNSPDLVAPLLPEAAEPGEDGPGE